MEPDVLRRTGAGELVLLDDGQAYGREQKVADELNNLKRRSTWPSGCAA